MPIPNAYNVQFSGPKEAESGLVDGLTKAGLAAEMCRPMYDNEADSGWVRVLAHEGHDDPPSLEFQRDVMTRAGKIVTAHGYSQRGSGITAGAAYRI